MQEPTGHPDEEALEIWSGYAKDRYLFEDNHHMDFRGRARQLTIAVPVLIGLEMTALVHLMAARRFLHVGSLSFLATALLIGIPAQLIFWIRAIRIGYVGQERLPPERPSVLLDHLAGKNRAEVLRMVGGYYAKATDALHTDNNALGAHIRLITNAIMLTLFLVFAAYMVVVSYGLKPASEVTVSRPGPAPASPAPSTPQPAETTPAPAAPSPALVRAELGQPPGKDPMNYSDVLTGVSLVIALASAAFAGYTWHVTRQATLLQALTAIQMEYRSPEMLDAVSTMWRFFRANGRNGLLPAYDAAFEADMKAVAAADPRERLEILKTTLHYKRRLVSTFYVLLAELYTARVYPRKQLFTAWSKGDLRIIPDILLPIEEHLGKQFHTGRPKRLMEKLYNDAPPLLIESEAR